MERIDKIIYATTFKNNNITSLILVFNDENGHPYLLYADDIVDFFTFSAEDESFYFNNFKRVISIINAQLTIDFLNDKEGKNFYTILDLKPPKPITKKEIEDELGYKIQIVDE